MSSCQEILVHQSRNEKKELKSGEANQTQLASVPLLEEGNTLALEYHPLNVNDISNNNNIISY